MSRPAFLCPGRPRKRRPAFRAVALLLEPHVCENMCHGTTLDGGAVAHEPSHLTSQQECHGTGSAVAGLDDCRSAGRVIGGLDAQAASTRLPTALEPPG